GLREELRAEADAQHRHAEVEQSLEEHVLVAEPGMAVVLVGVHRAPEDQHRAVVVERPRQGRAPGEAPLLEPVASPLDGVREDAGAHGLAVDDRQDVHQLAGTFSAWRSFRSSAAFAAACATRPPRPSGLVALLLKNPTPCSAWPESSRKGSTHSRNSSLL